MATDVSSALPQVDLSPRSTLTVTLSDSSAKVTQLNVHGTQPDDTGTSIALDDYMPAFTYGVEV